MIVRLTEMYDLSTAINKMGLISIRTPTMTYINKKWPGFIRNFKFVQVKGVDVQIASASTLPVDPAGIGTSAGQVAPQDMFNPLLYRVVSNDSWNGILNRIYSETSGTWTTSLSESVKYAKDAFPSASTNLSNNIYYGLLADESWKKAHPQQGLTVRNVRPLVWSVLHTLAQPQTIADVQQMNPPTADVAVPNGTSAGWYTETAAGSYLRGHAQPMPRIPTVNSVQAETSTVTSAQIYLNSIPRVYCVAIVTPPSTVQVMYYRMVVNWFVEFTEPRSEAELGLGYSVAELGRYSRLEDYYVPASKLDDVSETAIDPDEDYSVSADGLDNVQLVMEK